MLSLCWWTYIWSMNHSLIPKGWSCLYYSNLHYAKILIFCCILYFKLCICFEIHGETGLLSWVIQKLEELTCLRLNSEVVGAHVCVPHISKLMGNVCLRFFFIICLQWSYWWSYYNHFGKYRMFHPLVMSFMILISHSPWHFGCFFKRLQALASEWS